MPVTNFKVAEKYSYQNGLGSYIESVSQQVLILSRKWGDEAPPADTSEAEQGALPIGQNSPQKPPFGLYAEKLSGTAFTAPRDANRQTWLYRILPSASHRPFEPLKEEDCLSSDAQSSGKFRHIPNQLRWDPFDFDEKADWISGLHPVAGAGDPVMKTGLGISILAAGRSMKPNQAFYSADGDILIVVQHGTLDIKTELGNILVRPNEIAVIPRGIKYRVDLPLGLVRAYTLELYDGHFELPELGPIGSNGLANIRDFQIPIATYKKDTVESEARWEIVVKYNDSLFQTEQHHSPFDVVAWHGNYYPYKYDLGRFNVVGSISFDHIDPSVYTVLSAQSTRVGTAVADFVIFPPRWLVMEDTFRPPWYHRNTMSEFMGLIQGDYDAKSGGGFKPAGASLHNIMAAHGPDSSTYEKASNATLTPTKVGSGSMAFMFESSLMLGVTSWGLKNGKVQNDYNQESWIPLQSNFKLT